VAVNNKIKEINMEILTPGKLLKKARLEKNLSQIELAKKLGYTSSQMISTSRRF
jgi:predicted transcriptional regulator